MKKLLLAALFALGLAGGALAQTAVSTLPSSRVTTNASSTIGVTDTFQQIWPVQSARVNCGIQNNSANSMWVWTGPAGGTPSKTTSVVLAPGQYLNCATSGIVVGSAVWITGTASGVFYAGLDGAPIVSAPTTVATTGGGGGGGTPSYVALTDGTNFPAAVKAPSTAPAVDDRALVVAISPNSVNPNGQATMTASAPVVLASDQSAVFTKPGNSAAASDGLAPVVSGSAVSSLVLKSSAGNLYDVYATCSSACYLMLFNATALPSNGATTAGIAASNMQQCVPVPANGTVGLSYSGIPPEVFTTGITAAISSTSCATLTASAVGFIHGRAK